MELIKRNKKMIIIVAATICVAAFSVVVFAQMTAADKAMNEFTVGENVTEIVETWNEPKELVPGEDYTKNVAVKNTGTVDCFVRVFAEIDNPETAAMIDVDYNITDWIKYDDYWYYIEPIAPGETTRSLFTTLSVSENAEKPIDDFAMIVYSESTQKGKSINWREAFNLTE